MRRSPSTATAPTRQDGISGHPARRHARAQSPHRGAPRVPDGPAVTLRIATFEPWHLDTIEVQRAQDNAAALIGTRPVYAEALAQAGWSFTGLDGKRIIGCAGVVPWTPWRGTAWAILGTGFLRYRSAAVICMREGLDDIQRRGMHRIEAPVRADRPIFARFLQRLGFVEEATLRAFGEAREDFISFVRIPMMPELTIAEALLAAGTTITSVAGSAANANAQASAFAFQAAVQRQQAERSRQLAERESQIAAVNEARKRNENEKILGARRARLAASGVDPSSGTALLQAGDLAADLELDALLLRARGEQSANSLLNNGFASEARATLSLFSSAEARRKGAFDVGTTLLTAASGFAR